MNGTKENVSMSGVKVAVMKPVRCYAGNLINGYSVRKLKSPLLFPTCRKKEWEQLFLHNGAVCGKLLLLATKIKYIEIIRQNQLTIFF